MVLLVGEVAAVVALHRLGAVRALAIPRHDLTQWLRATPAEDVLLAGIRLGALIAAWWLFASTLLYVATRLTRLHGAANALQWATPQCVRRWVDAVAAASIMAASALGAARPAAADPPPTTGASLPPVIVEVDHRDRPAPGGPPAGVRTGRADDVPPSSAASPPITVPVPAPPPSVTTTAPAGTPSTSQPRAPTPPHPAPLPAPAAPTTHTILAGENLWSVAADHLAATSRRKASDLTAAEIAPYWSRVVEVNRPRLRSGDSDLVYPGEIVELPPLT